MSGSSFGETCPKCGNEMLSCSDWKPHNSVSGECLFCGFEYWTVTGQRTLDEVNDQRKDIGLRVLKKLRKNKGDENMNMELRVLKKVLEC